jgi:hypothetical protein
MRRITLWMLILSLLAIVATSVRAADDDDEALNLAPVKKGATKSEPTVAPTAAATLAATLAPTIAPTAAPTPEPTPKPKPKMKAPLGAALTGVSISQTDEGVRLLFKAAGPINAAATNLAAPERVLIKLSGATLAGSKLPRETAIGYGLAKRLRLATKNASELWAVVDLDARVAFKTSQVGKDAVELVLMTGALKPTPEAQPTPRTSAEVPKVNLMLFDLNVIYQDKQYDRFPCANFIYNAGDAFPLKREFVSTLVFYDGYGAFVGNVRILDPKGQLVAQTEQPFAFNLFNRLTDFMVELPWKVEFKEKGIYTLFLALNGSDVVKHEFYVGHNSDAPPAPESPGK